MTFQSNLPPAAGLYEKALEAAYAPHLDAIRPEIIKDYWDPNRCPAEHLSSLAHALSVDLWNEKWSELKKRSVLRRWVTLEFSKGTFAGYRDFIEIAGGKLREMVIPPGRTFATRALTKDEWDAWVDQHPRVIVKLARRQGRLRPPLGTFSGVAFAGFSCVKPEEGGVLLARRAVFRASKTSPDQDIQVMRIDTTETVRQGQVTERLIIPAKKPRAIFAKKNFAGYSLVSAINIGKRCYSYTLSRDYVHRASEVRLTTLPVGFQPRDIRYYRISDEGKGRGRTIARATFAGRSIVFPDRADELMGDVLYLNNPDITVPRVRALSFAGYSRVNVRPFQAEFRISLDTKANPRRGFAGRCFAKRSFTQPDDPSGRKAVIDAIRAARASRDRVLVTFQNYRRRTLGDGFELGEGAAPGGPVGHHL